MTLSDIVRERPSGRNITITLPGIHNVLNTLAALSTTDSGASQSRKLPMRSVISVEQGGVLRSSARSMELPLIDDYAHHPTEIKTTLAAARSRFQHRRIWAIWQPHTYSRTRLLEREFINSFTEADVVVLQKSMHPGSEKRIIHQKSLLNKWTRKKPALYPNSQR